MSAYIISTDVCYIKKQWAMCTALQILSGREASYENTNRNHSLKHVLPEAFSNRTQLLAFLLHTHTQILHYMSILHLACGFPPLVCNCCACLTTGQNLFCPVRGYIPAGKDESKVKLIKPLERAATHEAIKEGYSRFKLLGEKYK